MATRPKLFSFFRIPIRLQRLTLEAGWELLRARISTLRSAKHYTRFLGTVSEASMPAPAAHEQEIAAAEIGAVVERISGWMPFRALCLQQAIAMRRMLDRRDLPATVYLGLMRDPALRTNSEEPAHAWVQTGGLIVMGNRDLDRFAVVGTFA
ncbi:MAG: lasso peptide biosynthesis B2 protein [Paracoccaceae bacterium]